MRALLLLACSAPLIAACADPGGVSFRGRPLFEAVRPLGDAYGRLTDSAYSAGARTGERLGLSPPADTPRAGEWRPRAPADAPPPAPAPRWDRW